MLQDYSHFSHILTTVLKYISQIKLKKIK